MKYKATITILPNYPQYSYTVEDEEGKVIDKGNGASTREVIKQLAIEVVEKAFED